MVDNCKHVNRITPSSDHSILNPQKWLCSTCGTTESVWACLSCSNVACGRYIEEHAVKHYKETKHPLALEVNEKYAYCYECGDYILNDNPAGDLKILRNALSAVALQSFEGLKRRGRRILRSQSYSSLDKGYHKRLQEQDRNHTILWFRRYYLIARAFSAWKQSTPSIQKKLEKEEKLRKKEQEIEEKRLQSLEKLPTLSNSGKFSPGKRKGPFIPGVTGLRNLGNTCYMNSVLQVLRYLLSYSHQDEFRTFFLQPSDQDHQATAGSSHSSSSIKAAVASSPQCAAAQNALFARQTTMECLQHVSESGKKRTGLNGGSSKSPSKKVKLTSKTEDKNAISLCSELHTLLRVMWSGKAALVSPHKMLSAVWQLIPFFKGYTQQDAQEFLCEFLDKLSVELESSISAVYQSSSSSPSLLLQPSRSTSSLQALQRQLSSAGVAAHFKDLVSNMFHGELVSEVTCQKCGQKSRTKEPFTDLSLEFPERYHYRGPGIPICYDNCHVEEMLEKFTEKESLEGKIYACEQCNKKRRRSSSKPTVYTEVQKQFTVQNLPSVLRLHLKRFMWSGRHHRGKIAIHVDFSQDLDMRRYSHPSSQAASYMYTLNAVVMHHGRGFGSGHYTAFCWNQEAGSWVHCNDAKLEMTSIEKVMNSQAYILFYTQKPIQTTQPISPQKNAHASTSTVPSSVPRGLRLFDEKADEDITFNHQNSTIPRFLELKRKLSEDHSGRMFLKKRKSNMW